MRCPVPAVVSLAAVLVASLAIWLAGASSWHLPLASALIILAELAKVAFIRHARSNQNTNSNNISAPLLAEGLSFAVDVAAVCFVTFPYDEGRLVAVFASCAFFIIVRLAGSFSI